MLPLPRSRNRFLTPPVVLMPDFNLNGVNRNCCLGAKLLLILLVVIPLFFIIIVIMVLLVILLLLLLVVVVAVRVAADRKMRVRVILNKSDIFVVSSLSVSIYLSVCVFVFVCLCVLFQECWFYIWYR